MVSTFTRVILFILSSILSCSTTTEAFTNNIQLTNYHGQQRRRLAIPSKLDVEPVVIAGAVATAGAAITTWYLSGANDREKQAKYAEWEAKGKEYQEERERLAYIEPKEVWREEELNAYDGGSSSAAGDENNEYVGPLLMAVKGDVFNVWKGRNFYGPGGEYHIMAGRNATRFLAKNRLEEESEEERKAGLNIAERASLEAWYWTIKNKYERVGSLEGYDPKSTDM